MLLTIGTNFKLETRCAALPVFGVCAHVQAWCESNPVANVCSGVSAQSASYCVFPHICAEVGSVCVCVCALEVTYRVKGDALDSCALLWQVCWSCICMSTTRPCLQQDVSL